MNHQPFSVKNLEHTSIIFQSWKRKKKKPKDPKDSYKFT